MIVAGNLHQTIVLERYRLVEGHDVVGDSVLGYLATGAHYFLTFLFVSSRHHLVISRTGGEIRQARQRLHL